MHVGVDIGGTFTDIVVRLPDGTLRVSKVSSTPEDPGLAVVTGLTALLRSAGIRGRVSRRPGYRLVATWSAGR